MQYNLYIEGMKAYRCADGHVQLFRPEKNAARLQATHERLCIPTIPIDYFVQAVATLVSVDQSWVPSEVNTSLYIRSFTIATERVYLVYVHQRSIDLLLLHLHLVIIIRKGLIL